MTTPTTPTTDPAAAEALERYLDDRAAERIESYKDLIRIPSISALPEHAADCRRTAEWIVADLERIGMEHAEVSETGGHPMVYADWLHAPGAPTVLVYCHYDVQPVDPLDLWTSPPFEPVVESDRMLGRGVADDKGQLHIHLRATEALLATRGRIPVNLKFVFEGEEESSSVHLDPWLTANRERLAADFALISDTGFFEGNIPAITVGLRGLMYAQIDVTGSAVDLHSGGYGGAVENPANALATIIAGLKGADGRILIPGFYDDVVDLSAADKARIAALPFDEAEYLRNLGLPALHGEVGYGTLERRGVRPTLDVNGIWGGFQGEGSKTIIPAHAHAKVSCRLVANQDPDRIFAAFRGHVLRIAPPGVRTEVRSLGGGRPSSTPIDHPATQAAARALEATFGREPVYVREGGSIPVCASFETILELPVVLLGFDQPDNHAHAPNEWMDLRNYETGIRAVARMWDEVAALDLDGLRRWKARTPPSGRVERAPSGVLSDHADATLRAAVAAECGATMHPTALPGGRASVTNTAEQIATSQTWRLDSDTGSMAPRSALDVLVDLNDKVTSGRVGEYQPVPLGFTPMDKTIGTGLRAGELLLIGGAQGTGKTTMALQMARNIASGGQANVLYICFEHDEQYLLNRLIAMESALAHLPHKTGAIKIQDVRKEILGTWMAEGGGAAQLASNPRLRPSLDRIARYGQNLFLLRGSQTASTVDNIRKLVQQHRDQSGDRRLVVFVDYLQKVPQIPEPSSETEKVTYVVNGLKDVALSEDVPMIAIVAADKEGLKASRLRNYHLRGSSAINYEADIILILNEKYHIVAKVNIEFNPYQAQRFRDWVVVSVEKNRGGQDNVDLEFEKHFEFSCFDPNGRTVQEKLIEERLYND